jgi:subtilisin family serine protease
VTRASYSNFGVTGAIAAPGGNYPQGSSSGISGLIRGACSEGLPNTADGLPASGESFGCFSLGHTQYVQAMGSSASAALVAGAVADLEAAHPDWSAAEVVHALQTTASKLPGIPEPGLDLSAALAVTNPAP